MCTLIHDYMLSQFIYVSISPMITLLEDYCFYLSNPWLTIYSPLVRPSNSRVIRDDHTFHHYIRNIYINTIMHVLFCLHF